MTGRSSIPEAIVLIRNGTAYWMPSLEAGHDNRGTRLGGLAACPRELEIRRIGVRAFRFEQ
jgi:hypothetical protein